MELRNTSADEIVAYHDSVRYAFATTEVKSLSEAAGRHILSMELPGLGLVDVDPAEPELTQDILTARVAYWEAKRDAMATTDTAAAGAKFAGGDAAEYLEAVQMALISQAQLDDLIALGPGPSEAAVTAAMKTGLATGAGATGYDATADDPRGLRVLSTESLRALQTATAATVVGEPDRVNTANALAAL